MVRQNGMQEEGHEGSHLVAPANVCCGHAYGLGPGDTGGVRFAGTHSYTSPANCNGNVHTKACNAHAYNGPGNNRYGRRPTNGCGNCHAYARSQRPTQARRHCEAERHGRPPHF